jgi:hypothetical protein
MSTALYPVESRWSSQIINRTRIEDKDEWYAEDVKRAKENPRYKAYKARKAAEQVDRPTK